MHEVRWTSHMLGAPYEHRLTVSLFSRTRTRSRTRRHDHAHRDHSEWFVSTTRFCDIPGAGPPRPPHQAMFDERWVMALGLSLSGPGNAPAISPTTNVLGRGAAPICGPTIQSKS